MDMLLDALANAFELIFTFDEDVTQYAGRTLYIALVSTLIATLIAVPLGLLFGGAYAALVGLVILRDLVIVTGAIIYNARIEHIEAEPSIVSKLITLAQILLVLSVLFSQAVLELPGWWINALIYSVLVTIVWSGVGYVWTWGGRAWTRGEH
mgnify:CR=1 FL=1